jgi:response regulator of citrate/malate metabolism
MPAKNKQQQKKELVISVYDMLLQPFRLHCQIRHAKTMRFRARNEHEQDHRLHQDQLDHTHEVEEGEDATGDAGIPD